MARLAHDRRPSKLLDHTPKVPVFLADSRGPKIFHATESPTPLLPPVLGPEPSSRMGAPSQRKAHLETKSTQESDHEAVLGRRKPAGSRTPGQELGTAYSAVSAADLERIKKDASPSTAKSQKAIFDEERLKLHELSQLRVEKWGNTILGQRRARLKAIELKTQRAEEEKERIDKEWADIRARERSEAVAKARQKQYAADPRVRALHRQALVSHVLAERKLQLALLVQRRQDIDRRDREEAAAVVSEGNHAGFNQMHLQSTDAKERSKRKRIECAVVQLQQIEKKKDQLAAAKETDRNFFKAAGSISVVDHMQNLTDQAKRKTFEAEEFQKDVHRLAEAKKNQLSREREIDDANQQEISRFLARKEKRELMKKAVIEKRMKDREKVIEVVAQRTAEERKATDEVKECYLRAVKNASESRREEEAAARQQQRARRMEEIEEHRREQEELSAKQKKLEEEERESDRQKLQEEEKEAKEDDARLAVERKEREVAIREYQKHQIDENARRREAERAAELAAQLDALQALNIDDEEFNVYAEKLIREWHERGYDVGPLMRALQGVNRKRAYEFRRILDTYDRLGLHMF